MCFNTILYVRLLSFFKPDWHNFNFYSSKCSFTIIVSISTYKISLFPPFNCSYLSLEFTHTYIIVSKFYVFRFDYLYFPFYWSRIYISLKSCEEKVINHLVHVSISLSYIYTCWLNWSNCKCCERIVFVFCVRKVRVRFIIDYVLFDLVFCSHLFKLSWL